MGTGEDPFPTGLRFLDQRLGGGIAPGGLLALTSPAGSQVELLFQELASEHSLLYLSLFSDDDGELTEIVDPTGDEAVDLEVAHRESGAVLEDPTALADIVPEESYVIVDAMNELERAPFEQYLAVLNALKRAVRAKDALAILHCLDDESPQNRSVTLKRADHVWNVRVSIDRSEITTELLITKSRENQILAEPLPLDLSEEVRIDTSRTIA